jgi:hypothetical protein
MHADASGRRLRADSAQRSDVSRMTFAVRLRAQDTRRRRPLIGRRLRCGTGIFRHLTTNGQRSATQFVNGGNCRRFERPGGTSLLRCRPCSILRHERRMRLTRHCPCQALRRRHARACPCEARRPRGPFPRTASRRAFSRTGADAEARAGTCGACEGVRFCAPVSCGERWPLFHRSSQRCSSRHHGRRSVRINGELWPPALRRHYHHDRIN